MVMCSFTNDNTRTSLGDNPHQTDLQIMSDMNNLYHSFYKTKKDTGWKNSVQRFESNLLINILELQKDLRNLTYEPEIQKEFVLHERGRTRQIRPQAIRDRVVQRSFNDNVLEPRIVPHLIYDNYASLRKRGTSLARKRFLIHLQNAYKEFGDDGVLISTDFTKYFDNIKHRKCENQLSPYLDETGVEFIRQTFKLFELDVSYLTDEEFKNIDNYILNCVELGKIPKYLKTGKKKIQKSLGVGFHLSQICGIFYPHPIDNFIKIKCGIKYYGRFMDDAYIMTTRDRAEKILADVEKICSDLGITINKKKTSIKKLTDWHTFLKINHKILSSGRVIRKIHNSTIRRERQNLRTYRELVNQHRMTFEDALGNFKSWLGTYKKFNSGYKIKSLKEFFKFLFKEEYESWMKKHNYNKEFMI